MSRADRPCLTYVLSRIGGDDGVSLEAMHWMRILLRAGFTLQVVAGRVDPSEAWAQLSACAGIDVAIVAEADPDPSAERSQREFRRLFEQDQVDDDFGARVHSIRETLASVLDRTQSPLLVVENFTLPWHHASLGQALAELIRERGLAAISRGHDFPQDRPAYRWHELSEPVRAVAQAMAIRSERVAHIAINTRDRDTYYRDLGLDDVTVIPNAVDVDAPVFAPLAPVRIAAVRRQLLGERAGDYLALCPVRPVARKRVDVAVELVRRAAQTAGAAPLSLVVTHDTKDAPAAVLDPLRAAAAKASVHLVFAVEQLGVARPGELPFDVWDLYRAADLALYFSDFEGFGNALLECVAARLPLFVNEYEIYRRDIKPVGLDLPSLSIPPVFTYERFVAEGQAIYERRALVGALPAELDGLVEQVQAVMAAKAPGAPLPAGALRDRIERNLALVRDHFSYAVVERRLVSLIDRLLLERG